MDGLLVDGEYRRRKTNGLKVDDLKLDGRRPGVDRLLKVGNLRKDQSRRSADKPMG